MADPDPKQAFADDPNFLARLSELDRGLNASVSRDEPAGEARPDAAGPPASLRRAAPPAGAPAPRRLPDLFPPPTSGRARTTAPAVSSRTAPPPAIAPPPPPRARVQPLPATASPPLPGGSSPETFYGLTEKPFADAPDLKFLYRSAVFDRLSQELVSAIGRRAGIVMLTGASGIGKTTLCRSVVSELDRRTLVSLVSRHIWNFDDLLRTVLADFGVISSEELGRRREPAARESLTTTLKDFLASVAALQASAVLVIDDADTLKADVLDEVRTLGDIAGAERLQIVIAGNRDLLATVDQYELRELARRITSRLEMPPLAADDVRGYVRHRLAIAGPSARVEFDGPACEKLFEFSNGNPKVLNRLCDRALAVGFQSLASVIGEGMVVDAAEHLSPRTEPGWGTWLPTSLIVLSLVGSIILGAAAAAWVFRDRVARTIDQWQNVPPAPTSPIRRLPAPPSAVPDPAGDIPSPQR